MDFPQIETPRHEERRRRTRHAGSALLLAAALLSVGCTAPGRYAAGQDLGRSRADCEAMVSNAARERCEASFAMDHAEYAREREALRSRG